MSPPLSREECCKILGVPVDATDAAIHQAYLDLAQVWHPDRFTNLRLKQQAEERLKEINVAYTTLKGAVRNAAATEPGAPPKTRRYEVWPIEEEEQAPAHGHWRKRWPALTWTQGPVFRLLLVTGAGIATLSLVWFLGSLVDASFGASASMLEGRQHLARSRPKMLEPTRVVSAFDDVRTAAESLATWVAIHTAHRDLRAAVAPPRETAVDKKKVSRQTGVARTGNESPVRPPTGLIAAPVPPFGAGKVTVANSTEADACVRLMSLTGNRKALRAMYLRAGDSASFDDIPPGQFLLSAELGRDWLPKSEVFQSDRQKATDVGPLQFMQVQSPEGISASSYKVELRSAAQEK